MTRRDQRAAERSRCQHVDCGRRATRREVWRIDDASVLVQLCDDHAFKGIGSRLISGERWATRTRR